MKTIFIVTTLKDRPQSNFTRCVGWFDELEEAVSCTKFNCGDIHETDFRWVVIEEVAKGFYASSTAIQMWFEWNPEFNEYERCEKPKKFDSLCGFGMG